MPDKFLQPCGVPGCGVLTAGRYCPKHEAEHQARREALEKERAKRYNARYDKRRPAYHAWYSHAGWRRYRLAFLARHPYCAECLKRGVHTFATEVDHIVPHRGNRRLFWDEANHQALCTECHSRKTFREDGGGGFLRGRDK